MYIFGIIMVVIGAVLYFGSKLMYKKSQKKILSYKEDSSNSDEEFLSLLNNSVIVTKIIGVLFVVAGAIFIFLL